MNVLLQCWWNLIILLNEWMQLMKSLNRMYLQIQQKWDAITLNELNYLQFNYKIHKSYRLCQKACQYCHVWVCDLVHTFHLAWFRIHSRFSFGKWIGPELKLNVDGCDSGEMRSTVLCVGCECVWIFFGMKFELFGDISISYSKVSNLIYVILFA